MKVLRTAVSNTTHKPMNTTKLGGVKKKTWRAMEANPEYQITNDGKTLVRVMSTITVFRTRVKSWD